MSLRISAILLLTSVLTFSACMNEVTESFSPGTIVAEAVAPDSSARAVVVAGADAGDYVVRILDLKGEKVIAEDQVSAPVGYHTHLISLDWSSNTDTVTATIDHDFGDNNIIYSLAR